MVEMAAKDEFMLPCLRSLQWVCVVTPLGPLPPLQRCVAHLPKIVNTQEWSAHSGGDFNCRSLLQLVFRP